MTALCVRLPSAIEGNHQHERHIPAQARPCHSLSSALALAGLATGGLALAEGAGDTSDAQGFGPNPTGSRTVQPLKNECTTGAPQDLCRNIGVTDGWYEGKTIKFLYTQNVYCDPSVASGAPSKCEAGDKYQQVPPGTTSDKFTDPLYIPVPLFKPAPKRPSSAPRTCPAWTTPPPSISPVSPRR
ncbi:hypothetical protein [Streptomyces corynorhini]|uniref:hypothetical protein n=1 Tax=Streptomyces corynorhini TaxID=2282652 RepID=UPI0011C033BD|nr:hypothetical protein [Streptomyces corynorhini]